MKTSLLVKVMLINVFAVAVGMLVVWLTVNIAAADFTTGLMREFNILPVRIHWVFLSAVRLYILWGAVAALGVAAAMSLLYTRRVLRPLSEMRSVTARIAGGDYTRRAAVTTHDEVARLACDLNRMADALERDERLRREMVADVAHELRTPLTNIRGYVEGMTDGVVAASQENLSMLLDEVMRISRLVDDLLKLAEADAARDGLQAAETDLQELVERALRPLRTRGDARVALAPDARTVRADPDKLLRILVNLLDNAMRYGPAGGLVRVESRRRESGIEIAVENACDSPPAPDDWPLLFERFRRGEKSRSRVYGGAGIGLAIVKKLVEAHGGVINAHTLPGGRVRVAFTLPAPNG